jgi:hypothetical protein
MTDDDEQPTWFADLDRFGTKLIFLNACLTGTDRAQVQQMGLPHINTLTLERDFPRQIPPAFIDHLELALKSADPIVYLTSHGVWDRPAVQIRTSFTASGSLPVEPKRGLLDGLSPGQIFAIAVIWVVAYVLPIYLYSQLTALR